MLITFEGIDGSGKSSLSKLVFTSLLQLGKKGLHTSEPTSSYLGSTVREIVLHSTEKLSPIQQALLFIADRISHVSWMKEQIKANEFIICDRYIHSTLAYQGIDEKTFQTVYTIHQLCLKDFKPDIVFLLDIDPIVSLSRLENDKKDNFEKVEFLQKVRLRYLKLAKEEPDTIFVLDGTLPLDQLEELVRHVLLEKSF